ncbi:unnamed protein product [Schistosoma margrebowiei]|uniref:Uncharacterized protein n=1 Tax=Schistosoma margrebowiei TaxID=48269 RepID=A0A183LN51_9TREM|nr:unnamed protein product [Schistosoma margrebowiei]
MIKTNHPNASYYACIISTIYGILIGYIFPIIGIFGLITNSIVVIIFFSLYQQKNLYFILLGILAITDIGINILIGWLWLFPSYGLPYITSGTIYYFILTKSYIHCRLLKSIQIIWCNLRGNIYILLAFTRLSLLLLHKPLNYKISTKYFIIILLITILIISSIISLPLIFYTDLFITKRLYLTCWFTNYTLFLSIYQILFSNSCLFQLTFVNLIDLLLLIKIIKWLKQHNQLTIHNHIIIKLKLKKITKIITLILLDFISFLSSIPSSIIYIILVTKTKPNLQDIRIFTLLILMTWGLIFLQSSLNIILYYKRIDYFRNYLMKLIHCH